MKDVRVPAQLMRAMAAEAEAAREARAKVGRRIIMIMIMMTRMRRMTRGMMIMMMTTKVIAAEGEHKASRSLRQAAEVITDCPAALQVSFNYFDNKLYDNSTPRIVLSVCCFVTSFTKSNARTHLRRFSCVLLLGWYFRCLGWCNWYWRATF